MNIINIENNGSISRYAMVNSIRHAEAIIDTLDEKIKPLAIDQLKRISSMAVSGKNIAGMIDACVEHWLELK